jgi:hypothetical protein
VFWVNCTGAETLVLEPGDGKGLSRFDDTFRARAKLWQLSAADDTSAETVASEQRLSRGMVEEQIFAVGLSGFLSSVYSDRLNSQQKDRT